MGALSDLDDYIRPYLPYITHGPIPSSPPHVTNIIFTLTLFTFLVLLFVLPYVPMRAVALMVGLTPLVCTHPFVRGYVIPVFLPRVVGPCLVLIVEEVSDGLRMAMKRYGSGKAETKAENEPRWTSKSIRARAVRAMDDDRLEDKHWNTEMREVELWENERWNPTGPTTNANHGLCHTDSSATASASGSAGVGGSGGANGGKAAKVGGGGWGKMYLRGGAERSAWTRRRDGWSGVGEDGSGEVRSVILPCILLTEGNG